MSETTASDKQLRILVTGASGFLGKRIVEELLAEEAPLKADKIVLFDIQSYHGPTEERVHFIQGDIRNYYDVVKACEGIDIIIHCAAIIDWGTKTREEVLSVNVGGTKNIISACAKNNINYLVYTSSLDAVFTGKPLVDINEDQPYPSSYHSVYCESKIVGEKAVLEATSGALKTCVLRPSDIYGEADPYHIDSLIDMAKSGFYTRLGNGESKCQHVYVGNMAYTHVLAAASLWNGNQKLIGNAYFITDGKGVNFFKFFDQVIIGAGYKVFPKNLWLPYWLAITFGAISEFSAILIRPIKKYNPKFTRFAVTYTCTDFTFSSTKAESDFGFKAKYNLEESLSKTIAFYKKD